VKFLCEQCKAKYQISDDKVAGKTVRMKCRKCGHMIEVRAAVTETSVASSMPNEAAPGGGGNAPRPPAAKPSTIPKSPLATSLSAAKPAAPRPATRPPAALEGAFKSSIQRDDEQALLELASADEWYAAINGVPVGPIRIGELRRKAALGAVTEDSLVWQEGMEEWRPVRAIPEIAAMVREAQSGRVSMLTPEPAPVKSIPPAPAAPVVHAPKAPSRPAPPRPAPPARSNVVPITSRLATAEKLEEASPAPVEAKKPDDASKKQSGPPPASERFSINPTDPFAVPPAPPAPAATPAPPPAASVAPPAAKPLTPLPPAAAPGPPATSPMFSTPGAAPVSLDAPGLTAVASAGGAAIAPPAAVAPIVIQQPKQANFLGMAAIALALGFGGVAAWAVFFKKPETQVIHDKEYIQVPVAPSASEPAAPAESASVAQATPTKRPSAPKVASAPAPPQGGTAPKLDLGNLLGGPSVSPQTGPAATPAPAGTGISETIVEGVVRQRQIAIRRTCWERGSSGVSSANITVAITLDASGHVTNASASGNDDATGHCLEQEVRKWNFGTGPGTVNIPFHFLRQ
jgi:predicted Zn finger-like uncharacterized protein